MIASGLKNLTHHIIDLYIFVLGYQVLRIDQSICGLRGVNKVLIKKIVNY